MHSTHDTPHELDQAVQHVRAELHDPPRVAVILGSGLGGFVDTLDDPVVLPYGTIPHMPRSGVAGHAGNLWCGRLHGCEVVAMQGRVHLYEGHDASAVAFGVRLMYRLGARVLVVTNAAGGIAEGLRPGSLVCIEDHLNLTGRSCLLGPNDDQLGPRFPDMSYAYDPELIELAVQVAAEQGIALQRGVYAGVLGPSYETPAEIRMLRTLGAALVGMSTVQEVIAARHLGMRVLGLSCVTNLAAGLVEGALLSHEDVQREAAQTADRLCALLRGVVRRLGPHTGVGAGGGEP